ncbi:V-type ATP synthase subunit A [Phycicoccus sp. Soil748]|uniref:V-type ATP synthase subunit A n=1 Tax=Phycicoccus sp. Soil748 TaxID=1736397 RepID=UPI0007035C03|nr:V-type ATP synthase subunit A [Phycicoccus sp. Soil748]KRE52526.1 ATPase [Phycicoccus sp. Soil748]
MDDLLSTGARVSRVSGPLVEVDGLSEVAMSELVALGGLGVPGEVVALRGSVATVQAYEYTGGLAVGEPARALGRPLSARLGPHLLGGVFDGLLRPLLGASTWLTADAGRPAAGTARVQWEPGVAVGAQVSAGTRLGTLPGTGALEHRVLVPPGLTGTVDWVAPAGVRAAAEPLVTVGGEAVRAVEDWPVRRPRPVRARFGASEPLLTGQRVLDAVFPVARGGTVAVPGGFGTGKTMLLQQIAKWCTAEVIVYVGCGERGNEMADVLAELRELTDPATGRRLAERTVIIANTSNMPMMAREASIYSGVTVAEYFRDMGYEVVVIADSTSRWAEALREFASRSGALPAEEGYPAELPSALAAFYERAGRVETLGGDAASVTIIGAVSPAGGDLTEPVTAHTERFVRAVWGLDRDLAYARHYPAVAWSGSFSREAEAVGAWYTRHGDPEWAVRRGRVVGLLAEADRLGALAALVGVNALPGAERVALLAGRLLREGVLQQSALSPHDIHCSAAKTAALVDLVLAVVDECQDLVAQGVTASEVEEVDFSPVLRAAQECPPDESGPVVERQQVMLQRLGMLR